MKLPPLRKEFLNMLHSKVDGPVLADSYTPGLYIIFIIEDAVFVKGFLLNHWGLFSDFFLLVEV